MMQAYYNKSQKPNTERFWINNDMAKPEDCEALYLIVQNFDGLQTLGFAWYRQDGNGKYNFTKDSITHWAPAPTFPRD